MNLFRIASSFQLSSVAVEVHPHRGGHIHRSWTITCADGSEYLLQAINTTVFRDPDAVMDNIVRVTSHLKEVGEPTITVIATHDGRTWWPDPGGNEWRVFSFVAAASSQPHVTSSAEAMRLGDAYGRFAGALSSLPGPRLKTTIPQFHSLRARWDQFSAVAADAEMRGLDRSRLDRALGKCGCCIANACGAQRCEGRQRAR